MNTYNIALFIHLLGVVTLFIAIALVQRGGAEVRGDAIKRVPDPRPRHHPAKGAGALAAKSVAGW